MKVVETLCAKRDRLGKELKGLEKESTVWGKLKTEIVRRKYVNVCRDISNEKLYRVYVVKKEKENVKAK